MNKDKDITIKKFDKEVTIGENKYKIWTEEEKIVKFKGDGKESEGTIEVKYKKIGDTKDETAALKVKNESNYFLNNFKLPKELTTSLKMKDDLEVPVKGIKLGLGISFGVVALVIGGLIWWWISSSRKEDKEEESL